MLVRPVILFAFSNGRYRVPDRPPLKSKFRRSNLPESRGVCVAKKKRGVIHGMGPNFAESRLGGFDAPPFSMEEMAATSSRPQYELGHVVQREHTADFVCL